MLTQSDIYFQQPWWPVKIKVYQGYHLGFCAGKQPIWSYLSSPLCLICLSSPSSVLFLCLTCSRRLFVPKCQESKAVIYWKILLDSFWLAVWNVRAELFTGWEKDQSWNKQAFSALPPLAQLPPGSSWKCCLLPSLVDCASPGMGGLRCWPSCEKQQKAKKLVGLPAAALASCSFSRSGQAKRTSGHMLPSTSHGHQKQTPLSDSAVKANSHLPGKRHPLSSNLFTHFNNY